MADPDGIYVDATFGGGGHSREIVSRLSPKGHLYGFDQDADTMNNIIPDDRFTFVYSNFRYMRNFMRWYGHDKVDGILADLGVSWHHFDDSTRGFSFRFEGPIDMRMNQKEGFKASDVLNDYPEERLAQLFWLYGELQNGRQLAQAIGRARKNCEKKDTAKLFQALRMEVNHEVDALREMLESSVELLDKGGRLVVITYHSIEDRMVKNLMKSGNIEGDIKTDFYGNREVPFRTIGKPIIPDAQEQAVNPRSRSAKLRICERI